MHGTMFVILTWSIWLGFLFQDKKMPPKRIAKRRSPPEDAIPKSKKVKGELAGMDPLWALSILSKR